MVLGLVVLADAERRTIQEIRRWIVPKESPASFASLDKKKVLLADSFERARNVRATLLRSRLVDVDVARNIAEALVLWRTSAYHLVLVALRECPVEVFEFWQEIKRERPRQRVAFLIGSPGYVSLAWPADTPSRQRPPSVA